MSGNNIGAKIASFAKFLTNNPIVKAVRGAVSLTVGIPVAVVATCALAVAYGLSRVARFSAMEFKRFWGVGDVKVEDPNLVAFSEGLWGAIGKVWTGFGIYGHLGVAKFIEEKTAGYLDDTGFGNSADSELHGDVDIDNTITRGGKKVIKEDITKKAKLSSEKFWEKEMLNQKEIEAWMKWAAELPKSLLAGAAVDEAQVDKVTKLMELKLAADGDFENPVLAKSAPIILSKGDEIDKTFRIMTKELAQIQAKISAGTAITPDDVKTLEANLEIAREKITDLAQRPSKKPSGPFSHSVVGKPSTARAA